MVAFSTNRRILTWLCIYPAEKAVTWQWKMLHIIFTGLSLFFFVSAIITVVALGFMEVLVSALNIFTVIALMYAILTGLRLRHGVVDIFESLSDICNECTILL